MNAGGAAVPDSAPTPSAMELSEDERILPSLLLQDLMLSNQSPVNE